MQRHRDGDISDLVRNTIIWIGVVIWLALGYIFQNPPGDAYEDTVRDAFMLILAIVIPLMSVLFVLAWVGALRSRRKNRRNLESATRE
jgi:heme/copper-type cytochrome/quinol oxidase subunit 2